MKKNPVLNSVYVIWQDEESRLWHPVAKLTFDKGIYRLNYTQGVINAKRFQPFPRMHDYSTVYESNELFPFFTNRIIQPNRPEFQKILSWLDTSVEDFNPLDFLGTTSGEKETDNYRILQTPKRSGSRYYFTFFASGIRYLPDANKVEINSLTPGERLNFSFDQKNQYDDNAILLHTKKKNVHIGFCPKYLTKDFKSLINNNQNKSSHFLVKKVNFDAPSQYRLLCSFETDWPDDFIPFVSNDYLAYKKDPI
jgi:hypothetical protein